MLLWSELLCRTRSENENTVSLALSEKQQDSLHSGVLLFIKFKLHLYVCCITLSSLFHLNWPLFNFYFNVLTEIEAANKWWGMYMKLDSFEHCMHRSLHQSGCSSKCNERVNIQVFRLRIHLTSFGSSCINISKCLLFSSISHFVFILMLLYVFHSFVHMQYISIYSLA